MRNKTEKQVFEGHRARVVAMAKNDSGVSENDRQALAMVLARLDEAEAIIRKTKDALDLVDLTLRGLG